MAIKGKKYTDITIRKIENGFLVELTFEGEEYGQVTTYCKNEKEILQTVKGYLSFLETDYT